VQHCCPSVPTPTCSRCILCRHSPPRFAVFTESHLLRPWKVCSWNSHLPWRGTTPIHSCTYCSWLARFPQTYQYSRCLSLVLTSVSTWTSLVIQKMKAVGSSEILEQSSLHGGEIKRWT
jgi:hypothetical protein